MSQDNENSLRFPLNVEDRPFVRFLIRTRVAKTGKMDMGSSKSINLFLPMDFQIADGASYDSINLGAIKAFEENRQTEEQVRENVKGKDRESIAIAAAVLNQMTGGTLEGATQVGLVTNNVAVNNMSTATFNDMQIRNFNFNFQLMPTTEKESDIIRKIENTFRKFMYPRKIGTGFALEYPPLFRISFHTPDGKINKFLPTIKDSYLTSLNTNYNQQGGNMYFKDGAPTDTSISLGFQEQRQLVRQDLYIDDNDLDNVEQRRVLANTLYDELEIGG